MEKMDSKKEERFTREKREYLIGSKGSANAKKITVVVKRKLDSSGSSGNSVDAKKNMKLEDSPKLNGMAIEKKACLTTEFVEGEAVIRCQILGLRLRLSPSTIQIAENLVHEFYTLHKSSDKHSSFVPSAAVFLSAKYCEEVRGIQLVVCHTIHISCGLKVTVNSHMYQEAEEQVKFYENILLMTIGFDFKKVATK